MRALEPSDLDALYLWENDTEIRSYGSAMAPYSRAMLWDYINSYDADPFHAGQLRLMIDAGGKTAGAIDLYNIDGKNMRGFVGIVIDPEMRGKGIGAAALQSLAEYCSSTLGLHQLAAVVPSANAGSIRTFLSAGYTDVATLPQWVRIRNVFADATLLHKVL